jgi:heme-degrading monooxygenase HmoA
MPERQARAWGYLVIWEFKVREGSQKNFEKAYGVDGDWVKLFKQDQAYIRTELTHDLKSAATYLTLDYWESEAAYDRFREQHRQEYEAIDRKYEELTESERKLGSFARAGE